MKWEIIILFLGYLYCCHASYGAQGIPPNSEFHEDQHDIASQGYIPSYMKNPKYSKTSYSGTYSGTKTGFGGTKTGYTGKKTGYSGTKTGYSGVKTGGTKTGYGGQINGDNSGYSEKKTWYSNSGSMPTYQEFYNNANQTYSPKCDPDCKNNGICIAPNTCHCPANFHGRYCEFEKKPCLAYPPLPINSMRRCSSEECVITCMDGHKFPDGTSVANMKCVEGTWRPTRADLSSISDCQPQCNPRCTNGGVCLSQNTCQCPEDYKGPQCQYASTACDVKKMSFNGGYKCYGDDNRFSCRISCPAGSKFSSAPATEYECLYETGVYLPQPIPQCLFDDVVVISTVHHHSNSSSNYESNSVQQSSYGESFSYNSNHYGSEMDQNNMGFGGSTYDLKKYNGSSRKTVIIQDMTPKGGICLSWAGVHYKTFDGKIYSYQSPCQHILLRDTKAHKYTITLKQGECKRRAYCPAEITIYLEDKPYILSVAEDGSVLFGSSHRLIPIPATLPGLRVDMPGDHVIATLDQLGITLHWDTNNLIILEGSVLLWNSTEGLCGRLDGNPENDFTTKEGTKAKTTVAMASSWQLNKIGESCDINPNEANACKSKSDDDMKNAQLFCNKIFSKDKFRKCSRVMDVSQLLETCQWDYCACVASLSPEECACSTVSVYAKECLRHGVKEMKNWRDGDTCPMRCPDGKIYKSCGPDFQPSCAFPLLTSKADNATCVEGCFCPEGMLLEGNKCVQKSECPCRLRNKAFKPGSKVRKDCNTCTCELGTWKCTAVACGARCGAVGDPHYTTFDGTRYDFMGQCTYTLLQTDNVTIDVENVACSGAISEAMNLTPYKGKGKPSCTKAVKLQYGGATIQLQQMGLVLANQGAIELPAHIGDILVRPASSLFIIVQLPNGIDLWWDGNTRVFVDVPPEFQGKTKGLCGTFNLNQKDDFLTPEGDIEQSVSAFANKWKTREFCDDVSAVEPEHPCKANVENKEEAEKYCSRLRSKLFEDCHWYVDVEEYYEECMYDMCACAGDVSKCLCPIIGDYSMACSRLGVNIQWRYNVKECELSCSGGQEYTVCADSCQRTCSDIAFNAKRKCKPKCVEGCACPPGQVLDTNNVCVPIGLCPCFHNGVKFEAGYKEVRAGRRERELCTCVGSRWECQPATNNDIQNYPPAEDIRSNCSAANHMEFTTCLMATPLTCKNMHLPPPTTATECRPGCQCKKGFVLDTSAKKCVLATDCPCHHAGTSYPLGHVMKEECNTCECKSGNWSCTARKCPGICTAWGDSHMVTFDSQEYDFEGVCSYLLAKGVMDKKDEFEVEIQNEPCGTTGATCSKSVTLRVGKGNDEEIVSLTKHVPVLDISKLKRIKLRLAGAYVFLDVPSLGISVQWDRGMRLYVKVDPMWQGRVKGLCGNFNGDGRDDFQTPSGGIAESSPLVFADSWKMKNTCPKPLAVKDHCKQRPERQEWASTVCGKLKQYPFTLCHSEVPPGLFVSRCTRDACACDSGEDCACACAALAAYAHACSIRGVQLKWRTQELCPMQCDEECSTYDACVPACPLETCDNTLYYNEIKTMCDQETCIEGCKPKKACKEGTVYSNATFLECVLRNKCKPLCLSVDGRDFIEGEIMEEDACHVCRCSKNLKICTGQPCPPVLPTIELVTLPPASRNLDDEPLKCTSGWTKWISQNRPTVDIDGTSKDLEPLPEAKNFPIGTPMCKPEQMTKIECRTLQNHQTPKETGLNVECSLEKGLVCEETNNQCSDFEIRIFCECDDVFQCLNDSHPSHPHPTNCHQFYECTPDINNNQIKHSVLKDCGEGLMYNPVTMVCDWPNSVVILRPECGIVETTVAIPITVQSTTKSPIVQPTTSICPPGQIFSECAFPCNKLCDHFKNILNSKGKCLAGQKCLGGCIDKNCEEGSMWRDEKTCVPMKDCTCYSKGQIVKPAGVITDGCLKCQCLNNALHCDSTECVSINVPYEGSTHLPMILPIVTERPTTTTTAEPTEASTMEASTPLMIKVTSSPPPECKPDRYIGLLWDKANPLPESSFSASSVDSPLFKPQYAVLNENKDASIYAGSWVPATNNKEQYIQVELSNKEPIYGVMMQGSPLLDEYVTSYDVMYGDDGSAFSHVEDEQGEPKVFRGPIDHQTAMKQMFNPPIEAKIIRIRPLTWHGGISVRLDVIGCKKQDDSKTVKYTTTTAKPTLKPGLPECIEPLGLESSLPIENIEVSSNNDDRPLLNLNQDKGWKPLYSTPGEWIMFDFTAPRNITGIKTKGGEKGWVTAYNVLYTSDLKTFNSIVDDKGANKIFPGNFDRNTVVTNAFKLPVHARYLKVLPMKWKDNIEIRVEPIGCFEPYPKTITESPKERTKNITECSICKGIVSSTCPCHDIPNKYYDGENCVSRDQCPCVITFMTYEVGATFRGSNCDECVCKLGGVTDCKPTTECKCARDLVPKLSDSCECLCEACPEGTKICPTSKICLPLKKWCDGLMDCPDDEKDCIHTTIEAPVITTVAPTVGVKAVTTLSPSTTTVKPRECPVVQCPPGYIVRQISSASYSRASTSDLPPPRARMTYQRYYRGGASYTKTGYAKGGFSKGGYSKGGFSKGGAAQSTIPQKNQAFTLNKPSISSTPSSKEEECQQFKCVPKLPALKPGVTAAPMVCSTPSCPPRYSLKMEAVAKVNECPQYVCVPPPESVSFCNVTGRTFNTFDGTEYKFDVCFHILARDNRLDAWTILIRKKCRVDGCSNELIVRQDDQLILVKPSLMIEYDNYEYTVEQTSMICFQKNSFDINRLGNGLTIKSRKYNFMVYYTTEGDVKIGVLSTLKGSVDGLCGSFDGDATNDRSLPDGTSATSTEQFARSWAKPGLPHDACQTKLVSQEKQKRVWNLCGLIAKEPLTQCGKVLNLDKWRSICLEKVCECADLIVNGTKRSEEQCRCLVLQQMVAECKAAESDLDLAGWRMMADCPADCPAPLVHYDCYRRACAPTCSTGLSQRTCPVKPGLCTPGCYCPEGLLMKGEQCVSPVDCLDCTCNGLNSPSKFTTFERDDLPFAGNCTYLASRDRNDTGVHKYQIYATNGQCEDNKKIICTKMVHLIYEKNVIHISKDNKTKKLVTKIGNTTIFKYPMKNDWATITKANKQDVVISLHDVHVELTIQEVDLEFGVRVPSYLYANQTEGLCGVCAGYQEHLVTSNGSATDDLDVYGKSWQASPDTSKILGVKNQLQCDAPPPEECVPPPPDKNPCYAVMNADQFGQCHALVDPHYFVETCTAEICSVKKVDKCTILEKFAAKCRSEGVCVNWRTEECPMDCNPPFEYWPCVGCEKTCENYDQLAANPGKCDKQRVEGCFCPEGKVRVNNTCTEPKKCLPCDANKEHFAGDEWQEDACTKCSCIKQSASNAHMTCETTSCPIPTCDSREDLVTKIMPDQCCPKYTCVPKQVNVECTEAKQMKCGYGQVLKLKTTAAGCKEYTCECKPSDKCEIIPSLSDVEVFEPGMERIIDNSECCPKAEMLCKKETCPKPVECPKYHDLKSVQDTGKCCPKYSCELPKDKCVVSLEWEASSKGGEKHRLKPELVLKDVDSAWLDGPCRSCTCAKTPLGATSQCSVTECPAIASTDQFVIEPRQVPFACCPTAVHVACTDGSNIYKVGENWTSPYDSCESYRCMETEDGKLEKVTRLITCHTECQTGWKYFPAASKKECCGNCQPVACVVGDTVHKLGEKWTSKDFCINYTCTDINGTLQVQSVNESCPKVTAIDKKQFVLKEDKVVGKCCKTQEPIACRVDGNIYQEGQSWRTSDPCKSYKCARDSFGRLSHEPSVEKCVTDCDLGWEYSAPTDGKCCGKCRQVACVVENELKEPGSIWYTADNCTTFSCDRLGSELSVTTARQSCPDLSLCDPEDIKNETCCQICVLRPAALSTCTPQALSPEETESIVRVRDPKRGVCINKKPIKGFKECRGSCESGTLYNNQTGSHESLCECCQAAKYESLLVELSCDDGGSRAHRVASPVRCSCRKCGGSVATWPTKTGKSLEFKTTTDIFEIPEVYARFSEKNRK